MVGIIKRRPSFSEQLGSNVGGGLSKGFVEGIERAEKSEETRSKKAEKDLRNLESGITSYAKFNNSSVLSDPDAKEFVKKNSTDLINQGYDRRDAIEASFDAFYKQQPKVEQKERQSFGSILSNNLLNQVPGARESRSLIDTFSKEGQRQQAGRAQEEEDYKTGKQKSTASFIAEHPLKALSSLAAGGIGAQEMLTNIAREGSPIFQASRAFGFQQPTSLSEQLQRTTGARDVEEAHKPNVEALELLGGVVPWASALGPIGRGLKAAGLEGALTRLFGRASVKAGRPVEQIAKEAIEAGEAAGIDLSKIAKGDQKEAARFYQLLTPTETPTVARVERVQRKSSKFVESEAQTLREEQIKAHPRHEAEVEDAVQRKIDQIQKDTPVPGGRGETNQANRSKLALIKYPKVREAYQKATAHMHAYEDAYVNAKTAAQKAEIEPMLMDARRSADEAEEALRRNIADAKGRSPRATPETTRETAQNKITKLQNDIAEGKEIELSKRDYNPERIAEAKSIEKKKPLPGKPKEDFLHKVHDEYQQVYQKRLDEINEHLAKPVRVAAEGLGRGRLLKEKSVLEKWIEHAKADKTIHARHLQARELAARKRVEEQIKSLKKVEKPSETISKTERVAKGVEKDFGEFVERPSETQAEKIAKEAGVPKEEVKEAAKDAETLKEAIVGEQNPSILKENLAIANKWRKHPLIRAISALIAKATGIPAIRYTTGGSLIPAATYLYKIIQDKYQKEKYKGLVRQHTREAHREATLLGYKPRIIKEATAELAQERKDS
ncbi:hypothetical protein UFOVP255_56 [uncultured Caudovirales phage]|uniref:Large polyvalent protein associated domain-containing protein n=1 Tax=uncultured Caudovirales phage TaxID=2100421 RepID=A0A6J5LHI0_9CAUD|nr:hypothetical protein UFOVP255_56 [uncultured Caudovirales phage]